MLDIGNFRVRMRIILENFGLAPFRRLLTPDDFRAAAESAGCAPRRRRPLIPETVAWLVMLCGCQGLSMTAGLRDVAGLLAALCPALQGRCVSEEAFCQARRGLTLRFWRCLFKLLRERFSSRFEQAMLWKTHRVLAGDGSILTLPRTPRLQQTHGSLKKGRGGTHAPQARLVCLCSVFTGLCVAFKFVSMRQSEHLALCHLVRQLRQNDLLLLDRGFFSLCRAAPHSA